MSGMGRSKDDKSLIAHFGDDFERSVGSNGLYFNAAAPE